MDGVQLLGIQRPQVIHGLPESVEHPIDKLSLKILQDPKTVFRLDASDRMPTAVGSKSFRKGMLEWFDGRSTRSVLDRIESSWPR